jgi:large subunit ribosomal protein L25
MTEQMPVLSVKPRSAAGKGEARRLRRTGLVPAVAYGKGLPSTPIAVVPKEVATVLKSERGKNTVIEIEVGGKKLLAMVRDFTVHPVKRELEHVDFIEVKLDQPVDVQIPLFATGKPVGVVKGGVLRIVHRTIPVRCLPDRIPLKVEADVTHLELGQHVATRDLKLPEGVVARLPPEQTLIAVVAPEKEVEEVAPGAPGAAAGPAGSVAPPAGGAAPAAGAAAGGEAAAPAKEDKKKK